MTDDANDHGPRILLLEDEWLIAEATARSLRRLGFRPLGPARTVSEALEILDAQTPDAALIDTILMRESSLAVADRLSEAGIPFAFYSGYDLSDLPPRFASCRMLRKPIGEATLKAALLELLGTPAAASPAASAARPAAER